MAKVPYATFRALDIWVRLNDGREDEARKMVIADLVAGIADDQVQWIAAQMLDPPKRGRGRPSHLPTKWLEAGEAFESLRGDGMKYEDAILATAKRIGQSPEHVESAVSIYRRSKHPE